MINSKIEKQVKEQVDEKMAKANEEMKVLKDQLDQQIKENMQNKLKSSMAIKKIPSATNGSTVKTPMKTP